tara:strand:- start:54 stop:350 length:297 start_codon:yes stop_codon:yes gene_type:complete
MADLIITITVNDTDQKVLYNDLLKIVDNDGVDNEGIKDWMEKAVEGKINNCWKRMQSNWTTKLMNDETFTDPLPSNKTDFVNLVLARPDYQDRTTKDG